ncbi:SidA/IucD/PvdA family monooxygenase [Streptomyces sp. NPDC007148]|uniref:SidA/IucD/PvdA family monooxygenase n=1 Tax=Streptomyces sp. NPDC007148 TaxID=3364775 RepID=UPI0036BB419B
MSGVAAPSAPVCGPAAVTRNPATGRGGTLPVRGPRRARAARSAPPSACRTRPRSPCGPVGRPPLRAEFHQYFEWAADRMAHLVAYGSEVTAVEPVRDEDGHVAYFDVVSRDPGIPGGTVGRRTRNISVAMGLEPHVPPGIELSEHVWHNSRLIRRVRELGATGRRGRAAGRPRPRVETVPEVTAGIYLQGGTEHTHGLTSTLLSTTAIRAEEIHRSLLKGRTPA